MAAGAISPSATLALDTRQAETIAVLVIVGIVVVGALISFIITRILWRVAVVVVMVVLASVVYRQRASIESAAKNCTATFFGAHLTPSNQALRTHCQRTSR